MSEIVTFGCKLCSRLLSGTEKSGPFYPGECGVYPGCMKRYVLLTDLRTVEAERDRLRAALA